MQTVFLQAEENSQMFLLWGETISERGQYLCWMRIQNSTNGRGSMANCVNATEIPPTVSAETQNGRKTGEIVTVPDKLRSGVDVIFFLSNLAVGVVTGKVSPSACNAACNAVSQMVSVAKTRLALENMLERISDR